MAVFSLDSVNNFETADDIKKVKSYLFRLNEQLQYMFSNLDPADNFNDSSKLTFAENAEKVATLEVTVDGINANVSDTVNNYNSSIRVLAGLLSLGTKTPEGSSAIELTGDKIALTTGKFTINSKNLTIDANGNGVFSGTLSANTLNAPTINGGVINGVTISTSCAINCGDDFVIENRGDEGHPELTIGNFQIMHTTTYGGRQTYCITSKSSGEPWPITIFANGLIECQDIYLDDNYNDDGSSWWGGWSLYQVCRAMWDCMKAHSWNPTAYDPFK